MSLSHVSAILLCLQAVVIELTIRTAKNISCHHDGHALRTCPKNLCKISVLLVGSNGFEPKAVLVLCNLTRAFCCVQQMEKVECQGCHVTFYCSNECMKKHAVIHKGACKRAKLRSKLATKPSTK